MTDFIQIKKNDYEVVDPGYPLFIVRDPEDGEFCAVRQLPEWCSDQYEFIGDWRESFDQAVEDCQDWNEKDHYDTGRTDY